MHCKSKTIIQHNSKLFKILHIIVRIGFKVTLLMHKVLNVVWHQSYLILAVYEGTVLSIFPKKILARFTSISYDSSFKYRDDKQALLGLFNWEMKLIELFGENISKIIVIGAGNGREPIALNKAGFEVEAYECNYSIYMNGERIIRNENINIKFEILPENVLPINSRCDIFWFGWGVYTHIVEKNERETMLTNIKHLLNDHGIVVISFWSENRSLSYINLLMKSSNIIRLRKVERGESLMNSLWGKFFTKDELLLETKEFGYECLYYEQFPFSHAVLMPIK